MLSAPVRAAMPAKIPTMTLRCSCAICTTALAELYRLADLSTAILDDAARFSTRWPTRQDSRRSAHAADVRDPRTRASICERADRCLISKSRGNCLAKPRRFTVCNLHEASRAHCLSGRAYTLRRLLSSKAVGAPTRAMAVCQAANLAGLVRNDPRALTIQSAPSLAEPTILKAIADYETGPGSHHFGRIGAERLSTAPSGLSNALGT